MTSKAALADYLKTLQARHTAKYNCPLGKKRCRDCNRVAHVDQFIAQAAQCKDCYTLKQKEYHQRRVLARELETGEPRRARGRPKTIVVDAPPPPPTRKKTAKK
jgi:hypothetical protein